MTEAEYSALTAACDALLRAPDAGPDRVALSWLHVLSEHPNNLGKYEGVFRRLDLVEAARTSLWNFSALAWTMAQSVRQPAKDWITPSLSFPAQLDVLLICHLVSADVRADAPDFYYGRLPEELASRGITSLVALHNHIASKDRVLRERLSRGGAASRVLLPRWSTLEEECRMARRARRAASHLLKGTSATKSSFQATVAREAARYSTAGATMAAHRVHRAVQQLCAQFKPRVLMVTWEGHAWERLAFHAAHSVDATIRCVGYQHTVLFPRSHALQRSLGKLYDPDLILTIGDVNREVLSQSDGLRGIPVMTYGSHRRQTQARPRTPDASGRCVVIPEGLEIECLTLFDFAVSAASHLPNLEFLLRTHPVLPFHLLARRHPRLRILPSNVRVSDEPDISADFARCDWALYRGSSSVVHAVLTGVRPVYVQLPGELAIDPLFAMKGWRRHVDSVRAFGDMVEADRMLDAHERRNEWEPARAFCDRYVAPANPEIVHGLLASLTGTAEDANLRDDTAMNTTFFAQQYLDEARQIIEQLDVGSIDRMTQMLADLRRLGGRLFVIGVGGGAGHASHAVNDFRKIAGIESYAPSDNVSELTARTNDEGWETSYAAWLKVSRLSSNDMLFVFSVGGGDLQRNISANIVRAVQYGKEVEAKVIGILGRDGGYTASVADACVIVPTVNPGSVTPHTESFQALIWHLLVSDPRLQVMSNKWEATR